MGSKERETAADIADIKKETIGWCLKLSPFWRGWRGV